MRISVLIPSRGRPPGLHAAVTSLHGKASGEHEVRYVIGCDAGDDDTIDLALGLWNEGLPAVPHIAARLPSLGALVNRLAAKCPADVYCSLADDVEILTEGWDRIIAAEWNADPAGVWWWCTTGEADYAIVSETWRAAAGRIFTDIFPYWHDDGWLAQVQRYVTGRMGQRIDIWLEDRARSTHRLHDLREWQDFFWSPEMRAERRAEARRIAETLGLPPVENLDALDLGRATDFDCEAVEKAQGPRTPPTPEYLIALARMRAMKQQKEAA